MCVRGFLILAALASPLVVPPRCWAAEARVAQAMEARDRDAVRNLLDQNADPNAPQADGMTALHWAAHHDDADAVKLLIDAGADASARNRYGVTPLALACTNGNAAIVRALLDAGADPNSALPGGETALMTASRTGRVRAVQTLLERGAEVDARERNSQTAIMWAAAEGHAKVVQSLIKAGADYQTPLPSGFTPLGFAVREGRREAAFALLEAGSDVNEVLKPNDKDSEGLSTTPLILAVESGHFELAAALLEVDADPNLAPDGYTSLHALTWVRKPIRGDPDPPPMGSGKLNSLDIVRKLVAHAADVNARLKHGASGRGRFTTTGSTPFLLATRAADIPYMKLLLELGADATIANVDNCTPLLAAAGVGALEDGEEAAGTEDEALEAVRLLLELGADPDAVDDNGETAMHGAAYQSRPRVVQLLAERGAHVDRWDRKNRWGWTPLMIAEGHRPGNFRPAPETIEAIKRALQDRTVRRNSFRGT